MAATMALTALSIDLMLPAFDEIRAEFGIASDSNETAAIITIFFLGMAVAQLVWGTLSDRFGRKPIIYAGLGVFLIGAAGSAVAGSFGGLLAWRFLWGIGSAAPRVIALSVIRDIYAGDRMARVMSFISAVFIFVPIVAPGIGALALNVVTWRTLMWLCVVMAIADAVWLRRLPETLDPAHRMERLEIRTVTRSARIVISDRQAVGYTVGMTLIFGALISYLGTSEQVWDTVYGRGDQFPIIFGGLAAAIAVAILINGAVVDRVGSRRIAHGGLIGYVIATGITFVVSIAAGGAPSFWVFVGLLALALFAHGLVIPNARSIAILDLGEVAGTASALIGAFSVLGAALLGSFIDNLYDGTVTPMVSSFFFGALGAFVLITVAERGRLFGDT